ncbi:MAG: putative HTH-type transcriptional regulator [Chloroflexi bacterium ADurb.Bin180]|nr:MAG: putative HTH-type transcriptional regulator [Chloroflexi bacterium ADurb.Bin180]
MKATDCQRQAQLFAALAHPVRLRVLEVLAENEACVCHLCTLLGQRQAYVSQQLARLRNAGLIRDTRDGLFVYYRLANPRVVRLLHEARRAAAVADGDGGPEAGRSSAVPDCPCPRCRAKRPNGGPARMAGAAPANKDSGGTGPQ